jgi:hypothetical protein
MTCYECILYNMLYKMLCNMIRNVLHNMLRAKKLPSLPPFPGLDQPACSACLFDNYLAASLSSSERTMPRFGRGPSAAAAGRSGVRGGGALASTAATAQLFLGRYLVYQASILRATYFMQGLAGFVIDFIQLLHGACVPVQEVKPGIDCGILSRPEGLHAEEVRQKGDHHLGHAWILRQSNALVAGPRCVMRCPTCISPSALGESADAA